jgi:type II secretory pathway pseudopilin PulG
VLLLVVWIVVGVLAVVVLGALAYGVQGARTRLAREVTAFEREVRPLLTEAQAAAARSRQGQQPS